MKPGETKKGKTNWEKLRAQKKAMPLASEKDRTEAREFWADADVVIPGGKTRMTVRFDTDVVEWFKSHGAKYQTRMNAVLRQFMNTHDAPPTEAEFADVSHSNPAYPHIVSVAESVQESLDQGIAEYLKSLNQLGTISLNKGDDESASKYFQEAANFYRRKIEETK